MFSKGQSLSPVIHRFSHVAYSFWLFTRSDLKTIVIPSWCFAASTAYAMQHSYTTTLPVMFSPGRLFLSLIWVWINLLPFEIENQRRPQAIEEDTINKPWRTMPSKRLTPEQGKTAALILYPVAATYSLFFGGFLQCFALICLGTWYNEYQGADRHPFERNLINACGYLSFGSGALQVLLDWKENVVPIIWHWMLIVACIVLTTVQFQDIPDQSGDRARGRKTLPLMIGDLPTRWISALVMVGWIICVPWFWKLTFMRGLGFRILGFLVACRTVAFRTPVSDKNTFRLWNLWMGCLYVLPTLVTAV